MNILGLMILPSLILFAPFKSAHASGYRLEPAHGFTHFVAKGKPALISIQGKGEGPAGSLTESNGAVSGEISIDLSSFKTGIDLRDEHMKSKYLEIGRFPKAVLVLTQLELPADPRVAFPFIGLLRLHGTEQVVQGEARLSGISPEQTITASFKLQLSKFGIPIPSFQGITVAEEVAVSLESSVSKVK